MNSPLQEALGLIVLRGDVASGGTTEDFFRGYLKSLLHDGSDAVELVSATASTAFSALVLAASARGESTLLKAWGRMRQSFDEEVETSLESGALDVMERRFTFLMDETPDVTREVIEDNLIEHGEVAFIMGMVKFARAMFEFFEARTSTPTEKLLANMGLSLSLAALKSEG